ncbi:putative ABC transporter substrate-binding protein [Actinacidiphila reveromycinica]|uniref:Putative ABC transporter substrate-binding protein n=1 Tax=Actinacidiphila reveromycinica TaxID=659352 RepID=A0A7U3VSF6_9ACTN|nr:transporter substrate-binding domain-containing protein [Streptomyces sp. SN-593]BBB01841.1 putative ABC transporter substrate-binding protein [Streptomyces sp. SN-593]
MPRTASRLALSAVAATSLLLGLAACGSDDGSGSGAPATADAKGTVTVGALSNGAAKQTTLKVPEVASIRAELPKSVLDSKELVVGLGFLPSGSPPIGYTGTDQKTLTGSEPDLGRLVAAVFGLKPVLTDATWDNLFIGIDSGKTDVGFSNITDTEQRKEKYDFASYRQDNVGFEVRKDDAWNFTGDFNQLAGKTVAVASGTNQEKILLEWQSKLKAEGKKLTIKYYQEANSTYLALDSRRIDAYFAPNPSVAYHVAKTAGSPQATRSAGTYSGAGASLQGLICATTKKDDGLVKPLSDAINYLIRNGQYAKWLAAWNLSDEAVPSARINPPGLPLSNS